MSNWFENMAFERKLRLSMLATSTVALLLAGSILLASEFYSDRRNLEHTTITLARISADNSTAALAFDDPAAAEETLEALRAERQIVAAAIYDAEGELFASYNTGNQAIAPAIEPGTGSLVFGTDRLTLRRPVFEGERRLGTIVLQSSTEQLTRQARKLGLLMIIVLLATLGAIYFLSSWLQRTLARPILSLANTVGAITARQDWSLRARRYGSDELGHLTDDFNTMLARTEQAVSALRESDAQLRLVTDHAPVLLARMDRGFRYVFSNAPNAAALERTPEDIIGVPIRELIGDERFNAILPYMEAALRGERVDFETRLETPRNGIRWFEVNYVPEPCEDGKPAGFLAVFTDITERRATEEEVARARDEALTASRAKDDFLAALSHELRTPLSPVLLLSSERAGQTSLDEPVRLDFETIRHNVELEARLIDDLLDLTRITRGKLTLQRRPLDLRFALDNALAAARSDLGEKDLSIVADYQVSNWQVEGDAVRLQQVFWNVLKNAVKFTPGGGEIILAVRNRGDSIEIMVRDTGIGMTPAELDRIFESFAQGDHMRSGSPHLFGGLGLGLSIARSLVELHDGTIKASSPGRGQGTVISVTLPSFVSRGRASTPGRADRSRGQSLITGHRGNPAMANSSLDGGRERSGKAKKVRVLLVEDHAPTRASLLALLTVRGYNVEGAASVSEALEVARRAKPPFDVLISDIGLPDGDGCGLMRSLRKEFPALKAVALSGYGMDEDIERSHAAGFAAHLVKPITVGDLDEALPALMEKN